MFCLIVDCRFSVSETYAFFVVASVEQVVAERYLHSGRTKPREAVLPLLEILGIAVPLVVILLFVGVGVYGAFPLIGVVVGAEISSLQSELQLPMSGTPQRNDIAYTQTSAPAFAFPSAFLIEADVV